MDKVSLPDHVGPAEGYEELLRRESMSVGRYRLPAGVTDPQSPHDEDEIYYVLDGRAKLQVADEVEPVESGDLVFVEREVNHEFFDIAEPLDLLVVFAPPEGSLDG